MSAEFIRREVVLKNPQGLHARPAEMLARRAMQFASRVELLVERERVDSKSILHLLTLGARQGTQIVIEAEGPDAQQAVDALAELFEQEFGLDETRQ